MTPLEYKLTCENEKLKKENKELKLKNKDLETEKKTLKDKLKIRDEAFEDLLKENKTFYYKNKYEIEKERNEELEKKLQEKEDYIAEIRGQLVKDSSNSSKPSSTDVYRKPIHSCREKTDRKQGRARRTWISWSEINRKNNKGSTIT